MTFGITPTEPRTSYGYIRRGAALNGGSAAQVEAFAEKPTADVARDYVEAGYLWNSGNFLFPAHVMLEEAESFEPEIVEAVRRAVADSKSDLGFCRLSADFHAAPSLSIDYAVLERTSRAAVVEGSFPWSDVGSWNAMREIGAADEKGNVQRGSVRVIDSANSYVHSEGPLVAAIGVEGSRSSPPATPCWSCPPSARKRSSTSWPRSRPSAATRPTNIPRCTGPGAATRPSISAAVSG